MLSFISDPLKNNKFRSDTLTILKDQNQKIVTLKINNPCRQCKVVVTLLLKEPGDKIHFYQLCRTSDKTRVTEVEYEINEGQSMVELNFFGIKKALKKDAMMYLKNLFKKNVADIYKRNASTIVLQLALVGTEKGIPFGILKYELSDKNDNILIKAYSPSVLTYDYNELEVTFVLENPEKESDSIYLELDIAKDCKIRPKELCKPTSVKNVFVFPLKHSDYTKNFKGRLCRKDSDSSFSDWKVFRMVETVLETVKRKTIMDDEYSPQSKILKSVSFAISENAISEANFDEYLSDPWSSLTCFNTGSNNKQILKSVYETKMLTKIARVGHDYAFGLEVTKLMENVSVKLPVVYILQDDVGDSPLHNAILKGQEERAFEILEIVKKNFPKNLYTKNTSNHTALILAPACGVSIKFVEALLDSGFNIKDKDIDEKNALNIAIQYKNADILEILVNNAIQTKAFHDESYEILSLIRQTVISNYFDGFRIFIESSIIDELGLSNLNSSNLNLDPESKEIFKTFSSKLSYVTPLPELNGSEISDELEYILGLLESFHQE